MKPRALDLFCGAGGASMGLSRAGFDVIGVDARPQPRYPFPFILADALRPPLALSSFDLIWASPPCQAFSRAAGGWNRKLHPDLIGETRAMLCGTGTLYVIENVPEAPLRGTFALDGGMFNAGTYRRRVFEANFLVLTPPRHPRFGPESRPGAVTVAGHPHTRTWNRGKRQRPSNGNADAWRAAMGIDWMLMRELTQAVPPRYAEYIGTHAIEALGPLGVAL